MSLSSEEENGLEPLTLIVSELNLPPQHESICNGRWERLFVILVYIGRITPCWIF